MKNRWSSLDIHIAAYLAFRGILIELETTPTGRVIFTAPQSNELYRLEQAYQQDDLVPIVSYIGCLRSLKARMFAARSSITAARGW